jgi:hypothetical protein
MAVRPKPSLKLNKDLKKFAELVDVDVVLAAKKIGLTIFKGVVTKTPVDTGRLRSNWAIGRQKAESPGHTISGAKLTKQAASNLAFSQIGNLSGLKPYERIVIANNLPYAEAIEYGHSKKHPAGMVRVTIAEVEQGMQSIINGVGE